MDKIMSYFKRPQVWGFFLSMAIMAVISVVYFAPDNFEGNSLMQSDIQQGEANGHEGLVYAQQTGEKALWTNSLFSGMPTFQISPTYPSNDLFTWLNGLYGLWLPSPSNLLFMMMFGFLILLYCMRQRWYYALIGAIAWGFSSYYMIIIGAGHIWKFLALTYIPPTIGGLVLCYRGRYLLGGALTALFAMLQLNANHPQMTYYFGFVMAGLVVTYLIYAIKDKKVVRWAIATCVLIVVGALAVGANLPSLYNTYEYSKETKRAQSELTPIASPDAKQPQNRPTGGLPKEEIVGWSYGRSELFTLLIPNVKGGASVRPEKGEHEIMGLDKLVDDSFGRDRDLLAYFTQYFNDSESTNGPVYVGALICALFLLGCIIVRGPMKWCLLVLTVLSMLLALGRNFEALSDLMIYHFPMYSKFRAVESILVIAEFTMPLLAILGLAQFIKAVTTTDVDDDYDKDRKLAMRGLYISFGVCAVLCVLGIVWPQIYGSTLNSRDFDIFRQMQEVGLPTYDIQNAISSLRLDLVRKDSLLSFLYIGIGFIALGLLARKHLNKATALAIVGCVILVDLYVVDKRYVSHDSFIQSNPFAQTQTPLAPDQIDNMILKADTTMSYRIMDIPGFGDARRSYFHKMIGGYHAAKLNRYEDLIQRRMQHVRGIGYVPELRIDSIVEQYPEKEQAMIRELLADYRVLDMLNAKYIITADKERPVIYNPDALGNAWLVDDIKYVTNADDEMAALATLDPATEAVADNKFIAALGVDVPARAEGDTIYMTTYSPNRVTYRAHTAGGGLAVFSEVYFPWGWRAQVGGVDVPIGRVDYTLRALRLPAGTLDITMTFDPESLHTTGTIATACISIIYLLLLIAVVYTAVRREPVNKGEE